MQAQKFDEEAIFNRARKLAAPQERQDYLRHACGANASLRNRVTALLQIHEHENSFLSAPVGLSVATLDEPITEQPGTVVGPYKLVEQIGEGGFGLVFMAEQQQPVRRTVAVKVLKPGMDSRQVIARFDAERHALALMDHPNIARVLDAGDSGSGRPYFVMELVRGVSITDYCDQQGVPTRARLELFLAVCHAVQHAHQKGVIHRDIKPSNVLVTLHDGVPAVKVIDFGIAKALGQQLTDKTLCTGFAQLVGTPLYMSPEQADLDGLDVDTRSDVYTLGVLLYELLTGVTPFDKERLRTAGYDEVRRIIREEDPCKPSTRMSNLGQAAAIVAERRQSDPKRLSQLLRGELDWIVMKALEKDRSRRYETANAFAADVQRYLHDEPVAACPPSSWYRCRKFGRRNQAALTAAALIMAACLAGTTVSIWQAVRATDALSSEHHALLLLNDAKTHAEEQAVAARQALQRLSEANYLVQRARFFAGAGQWAKANDDLTQAMELRPDHSVVWFERADFYARLGLWDEAAKDFAKGFPLQRPPAPRPWFQYALLTAYAKDVDNNRRLCALIPEHFPPRADCFGAESELVRAYTLTARSDADWQWALGMGKSANEQRGLHPWTSFALGAAHYRAGKYEEAIPWLQRALNPPGSWPTGRGATFAWLAMTTHRLGRPKEAREALMKAKELVDQGSADALKAPVGALPVSWIDWLSSQVAYREAWTLIEGSPPPEDRRRWLVRARALAALHWQAQAEAAYAKAAGLTPKELPVLLAYFRIYADLSQLDRAHDQLTQYHQVLTALQEVSYQGNDKYSELRVAWRELAQRLEAAGRPADARRAAQQDRVVLWNQAVAMDSANLKLNPKQPDVLRHRASVYLLLRQWDKAIADCSRAIALAPQTPIVWTDRGVAYGQKGQWDKARDDFTAALALPPELAKARSGRGRANAMLGEWDKALDDCSRAVELAQHYPSGASTLAWLLATHPDPRARAPQRAVELAKQAVAQSPIAGDHWTALGAAHYRAADWQAARAALEKAAQLKNGGDSLDFFLLAMTAWQLGDKAQAEEWYGRAMQWLQANQADDPELRRFRAEAAQLLGIEPK